MTKGLVLAGGGALGAYQIGAYEALLEMGHKFDIITGTSIGALNGSFIASNMFDELKALWDDMVPSDVVVGGDLLNGTRTSDTLKSGNNSLIKSYIKNHMSLDNSPLKHYMTDAFDFNRFYECKTRIGIVTTQVPKFKEVNIELKKIRKEQVTPFLFASSACVPLFPYEVIEKKKYIDGFFSDNLPVKYCFEMGATDIVAIDMRLFGLKPKNPYLLKLPNVKYIAPYTSLGSMIDFSQETIQKNKLLGYLDAKKAYKLLRGYYYCFENEFNTEGFMTKIINKYESKSKIIFDTLADGIRDNMDEADYFYRTIECLFDYFELDNYYKIFNKDDVIKTVEREMVNNPIKEPFFVNSKTIFNKYLFDFINDFILNDNLSISLLD